MELVACEPERGRPGERELPAEWPGGVRGRPPTAAGTLLQASAPRVLRLRLGPLADPSPPGLTATC